MKLNKPKKINVIMVIGASLSFIFLISLVNSSNSNLKANNQQDPVNHVNPSNSDGFNVTEFWNSEVDLRVNATNINLQLGLNFTITFKDPNTGEEKEFIAREVIFDSPNWVGAFPSIIRIHGYLIYPEVVKAQNPGCLCMHGLNGNANQSFEIAYNYLEKGFIVLCHSHPGHGESGGANPSHSSFYFEEQFNESSHFYLTICAAIQGLRVLEDLTLVNNSQIFVTGGSYGALNTMWLSGVIGAPRIAAAVPIGAVGAIEASLEDPTKLVFWIFDMAPGEIPNSFWQNQYLRLDPKFYLESPNLPPIFFKIGTNDEFFHYRSINGTYDAVSHSNKYVQIYPNHHHALPSYDNSTKFFIDYILNNGPAPPTIKVQQNSKEYGLLGDTLNIEATVTSAVEIESVQACYKYIDIVGARFETFDLSLSDTGSWTGILNPGILTSRVDYYIIVNLVGDDNVWFSTKIYTAGVFISNFTIPFYILLVAFISIPAVYLIWRRYKKNVKELDPRIQKEAKKYLIIELSAVIGTEALFYISLVLPWIVLEAGGIEWSHLYIFNNIFTWDIYFGVASGILTAAFLIGWLMYSFLSIMKPMLAGYMKIGYPILVFYIFSWYLGVLSSPATSSSSQVFGTGYPGIGLILMLLCAIIPFFIGIWKRKYQTRLGIRQPKSKWYNIDKWFKIKAPDQSVDLTRNS